MEISKLPDTGLLEACRSGDVRAWRQLVDRHEPLVYSVALNLGLKSKAADEVAFGVFEELEGSLDALSPSIDLARWLSRTARRKALWHPERGANQPGVDLQEPVTTYQRVEFVESLHRAFDRLDPRCSRLLMLMYFDRQARSHAELAELLELPEPRIGPMRARCLKCLRRALDAENAPGLGQGLEAEERAEDSNDRKPTLEGRGPGEAIQWRVP